MYEKKVLEKWLEQIKSGELNPEFIGLGTDKEQAIKKLQSQISQKPSNRNTAYKSR